jgi:hypothetical protein
MTWRRGQVMMGRKRRGACHSKGRGRMKAVMTRRPTAKEGM